MKTRTVSIEGTCGGIACGEARTGSSCLGSFTHPCCDGWQAKASVHPQWVRATEAFAVLFGAVFAAGFCS